MSRKRLEFIENLPQLDITQDVGFLSTEIVLSWAVPEKASTDAAHIAVASVHNMDYLLTWNCTHIANAEIYKKVQTVCEAKGFSCPIICTPEELMGGNNNEI